MSVCYKVVAGMFLKNTSLMGLWSWRFVAVGGTTSATTSVCITESWKRQSLSTLYLWNVLCWCSITEVFAVAVIAVRFSFKCTWKCWSSHVCVCVCVSVSVLTLEDGLQNNWLENKQSQSMTHTSFGSGPANDPHSNCSNPTFQQLECSKHFFLPNLPTKKQHRLITKHPSCPAADRPKRFSESYEGRSGGLTLGLPASCPAKGCQNAWIQQEPKWELFGFVFHLPMRPKCQRTVRLTSVRSSCRNFGVKSIHDLESIMTWS